MQKKILMISLIFAVILSVSYIDTSAAAIISETNLNETSLSTLSVQNTINNVVTIIITGIVKTCTSGDPFEGVTITLKSLSGEVLGTTTTDSNGFYTLIFQCSEEMLQSIGNTFQVTASYPGHISSTKEVSVAPTINNQNDPNVNTTTSSNLYGNINFQLGTLVLTKGSLDILGVDSNLNPAGVGPFQGLIQIHITNNASTIATNVWANLNLLAGNETYFWLAPGENATKYIGNLSPGQTVDVWYLIQLENTTVPGPKTKFTRNYSIDIWGDNTGTNSTINGTLVRDGYQSQERNKVLSVQLLNTTALYPGDTFQILVTSSTASDYANLILPLLNYDPTIVQPVNYTVNWLNGTVNSTSNNIVLQKPGKSTFYSLWTFVTLRSGTTGFYAFIDDVSGESSHYNSGYNSTFTVLNITKEADVASTKTVFNINRPGETIQYNDLINYIIKISNYGPDNATGVNYTDLLPAGLIYVNHTISTNGGFSWVANSSAYNPTSGIWNIGNISANSIEQFVLSITARVNSTNVTFTNNANKTAMNEFDSNTSNDNSTVTFYVPTTTNITVNTTFNASTCGSQPWPPHYNQTILTFISAFNNGPNNATGVQITDILPPEITFVAYSLSTDGGITWTASYRGTIPADTYNETTGIWNVGNLTAGAPSKILCISGKINATSGTTITNKASVTAGNEYNLNTTNGTASITVA